MEQVPAVSVLMPVYNAERYVAEAVESILKQTFTDFEFLIVNDGSTDRSLQILQSYAEQDLRIHLISRENRGLVATLNEMINLARAPLLARMDADDIAMHDRLEIQTRHLENHPEVVCVGGGCQVIDEHGRFLIIADIKTGPDIVEQLALQGVTPITHPTALMRTSAIKAVKGYSDKDWPAEDLSLWIKLCDLGKIDNAPEIVLQYRIHDQSISTTQHALQIRKISEICAEACKKRGVQLPLLAQVGRASRSRQSKYKIILRHGWWAFSSSEFKTAFIYGFRATILSPFKDGGWRLMACAILKRK